jgi:hypothetical protein
MRCDEAQEYLVTLLYEEGDASPEDQELKAHLRSCSTCRRQLEELQQTQKHLRTWKDESPIRAVSIPGQEFLLSRRKSRKYLRYAAIAAMALICFLVLADSEITLSRNGFSYRSHLFARNTPKQDYYTKSEVRDLVKLALDDSELRAGEANYIMARKILDMVERERWIETRAVSTPAVRNRNRN